MVEQGATFKMEDVTIILRNFSGAPDDYQPKGGKRTFGILLDEETAQAMAEDGWNVKRFKPREDDEDEIRQPWLPVEIRFDIRPPRVFMITSRGRTQIKEDGIGEFDNVDIVNADIIVRAFNWEVNEKSGTKAYVQSLYVTVQEDELELKYADLDLQ